MRPGAGTPFFNISGYTPIGGAITGPRNSVQTSIEVQDSLAWSRGAHFIKVGGEYRRTGLDMFQAIAPNAFYVFAGTFPTNNAIANLLLGSPVTFYQGLGNFNRDISVWGAGLFVQDEWRLSPKLTMNYGLRYERINPFTEEEDRLNAFVPGQQSQVRPDAPTGLLFPGDPGVGTGIAQSFNAWMPRVGFAFDPTGDGRWSVRASYGVYFDQFQNGSGTASQVAISALPQAQFVQFSGAGLNFQNPYLGRPPVLPDTFVRPSTVFAMDVNAKPPYAQHWNLSVQRSLWSRYLVEVRYVGAKGTHLPRNVEANPAVFGPGATAQNADRRRDLRQLPGRWRHLRFLDHRDADQPGELVVQRRPGEPVAPVRRRTRPERVVLVFEIHRLPVIDEPVGGGGQAARRRERPGAESRSTSGPSAGPRCSTPGTASWPAPPGSRTCRPARRRRCGSCSTTGR